MQDGELRAAPVAGSVFGEWLALRVASHAGGRLGLQHAEEVTRAVRGALLHHAEDPPPAVLSGHQPDGRPLDRPHAAFLALPDLEFGRAAVAAVAIVLPRGIDAESRRAILVACARWERSGLRLTLGRLGVATLEPLASAPAPHWSGPSRRWATVTPIALDRNPGDLYAGDRGAAAQALQRAQESVAAACLHIGLPRPASVQILRRSPIAGVPDAPLFAPFPRRSQGLKRLCVHASIEFGAPVLGPVLLGVGRYFGVGLGTSQGYVPGGSA